MPGLYHVTRLNHKKGLDRYRSNWRKTYKRDKQILGLKCENCGSTEQVERHHILEKGRHRGCDAPINLKLLCKNCHRLFHKRGKL